MFSLILWLQMRFLQVRCFTTCVNINFSNNLFFCLNLVLFGIWRGLFRHCDMNFFSSTVNCGGRHFYSPLLFHFEEFWNSVYLLFISSKWLDVLWLNFEVLIKISAETLLGISILEIWNICRWTTCKYSLEHTIY